MSGKQKGSRKVRKALLWLSLLAAVVVVAGGFLKARRWGDYEYVLMAGVGMLVVVAMFLQVIFPFHARNDNVSKSMVLYPLWDAAMQVTGFVVATLLVGALLLYEEWPGIKVVLVVAALGVAVAAVLWLCYRMKKKSFGNR